MEYKRDQIQPIDLYQIVYNVVRAEKKKLFFFFISLVL